MTEKPIFGRKADLAALKGRIELPGVTVVVGRARIGKSRLLEQLVSDLRKADNGPLVGYKEGFRGSRGLFAQSLEDLRAKWPGGPLKITKLRVWWKTTDLNPLSFLKGSAKVAVGTVPNFYDPSGLTATGAGAAFDGAERLASGGKSGGMTFAVPQYEEILKLYSAIAEIAQRPIVLVLDGMDQMLPGDAAADADTIEQILHHLEDWSGLHVLVGVRDADPHPPALVRAYRWLTLYPACQRHQVREFDTSSPTEQARIAEYIVSKNSNANGVNREHLLSLVGGDPAVLEHWIQNPPANEEEFAQRARDAKVLRYKELILDLEAIARKGGQEAGFLARLALLPEIVSQEQWEKFQPIVQANADEHILQTLREKRVLDVERPYPSYGHNTRHQAATRFWLQNLVARNCSLETLETVIPALASRITSVSAEVADFCLALVAFKSPGFSTLVDSARISQTVGPLVECAVTLVRVDAAQAADFEKSITATRTASGSYPDCAPLIAMGLVNTLSYGVSEGDRPRRDELLADLRGLAQAHGDNPGVVESFAKGLFNTLNDAKSEGNRPRRDVLLAELRGLAQEHGDNPGVVESFAMGLFNTLNDAKSEGNRPHRDVLLAELRGLAQAHGDNPGVVKHLAMGLVNTLSYGVSEGDRPRRDELLAELRGLAQARGDNPGVVEQLAMGLVNTLSYGVSEGDRPRRDELLADLRGLAQAHGDNPGVVERLAMGLVNTLNDAKSEGNLPRRDELLADLRGLAQAHGDNPGVVEQLAMGLFNTLHDAVSEGNRPRRDELLADLRGLARAHGEHEGVLKVFAYGLVVTLSLVETESNPDLETLLREELEEFTKEHPELVEAVKEKGADA